MNNGGPFAPGASRRPEPPPIRVYVEQTGRTVWWVKYIVTGVVSRRSRHRSPAAAEKAADTFRKELSLP